MREVRLVSAATVAVLASLMVSVAQCGDSSSKTTSSPPVLDEDLSVVEEQFCGDVVRTDRVHVPVLTDPHHRLLQLHVRSNLQVRTAPVSHLCGSIYGRPMN